MELLLVALGGALAIMGGSLTTWQQGRQTDRSRRRQRVEDTMLAILRLAADARRPFLGHGGYDADGPNHDEYEPILREIEIHIPVIDDAEIRRELHRAVKCLRGNWGARNFAGLTPFQTGQTAYAAVSSATGQAIRGERFSPSKELAEACSAIDEYYELMAENDRKERERHRRESNR